MLPILEETKYRGYSKTPEIIFPSTRLTNVVSLIDSVTLPNPKIKRAHLKSILSSSEEFLNTYYDLHYIPYESKELIIGPFNFGKKVGNINPFDLPIKQIYYPDDFYGCLREVIAISDNETKLAFNHIELSKHVTEMTSLSYTHEIIHTELNHMLGLIRKYHNSEVLSIFNETLHAYLSNPNETLLRAHDYRRLKELVNTIKELACYYYKGDEKTKNALLEGSCYCVSTLKAYNLFISYYFGNNKIKKHIIESIQHVLDGEITLEEMLLNLNITFENSQDTKILGKYLNR